MISNPNLMTQDPFFETQSQSRKGPDVAKTSESTSSSMRKASSTTNIVDDLSSIFGGIMHELHREIKLY